MKLKYILFVLMMSLLVVIPSGSFFLPQYLTNKIMLGSISESEVIYGVNLGIKEVIHYRFLMLEEQSKEWFHLANVLAKTEKDVAFKLATLYYIEGDIKQAIHWYKKSSNLNHTKAKQELVDLYISENQFQLAKQLLLPLTGNKSELSKLLEVAITLGDKKLIEKLVPRLEKNTHRVLLAQLKKYRIIDPTISNKSLLCHNSIQLFATSLKHLKKLDKLISEIQQHPLNEYFCFKTPRYVSSQQLNCRVEINKALQCDATMWEHVQPEVSTRYIGIMLNKGVANVDNGIMYLDEFDDEAVFIHELTHLLGFVDEYRLPKRHKLCQNEQISMFSHNISILKPYYKGSKQEVLALLAKKIPWFNVIKSETPLLTKVNGKWIVGTPNTYVNKFNRNVIGLFKSETCGNNNIQAFKPTMLSTNLRYYEEEFIGSYLGFLKENPKKFIMPSYYYNVAKALFNNDQTVSGFKWLQKALDNELNSEDEYQAIRYNKIKLGQY